MSKGIKWKRNEVKIENQNFQSRDLCLRAACHKLVMRKKQRRNGVKDG